MFTTSLFKKTLALMVMMYASMSFAAGEANTAADKSVAKSPVKAEKGITQPGLGNKTATKSKSNINNNKTGATAAEAPSADKKMTTTPVNAEKGISQPGLGNKTATKSKSNVNNNKTGATATEAPSAEKK